MATRRADNISPQPAQLLFPCPRNPVSVLDSTADPCKTFPKSFLAGKPGLIGAALDWALSHGLPCGGWCPKGRKSEDGAIDSQYPLKESSSASYLQRTEWNVRNSDATILFSLAPELTGGSKKTVEFAKKHHKPWIHLAARDQDAAQRLSDWLTRNAVYVLNVAGPRASKEPGIANFRHP